MDKFRVIEILLRNPQISQKKIAGQAMIPIDQVNHIMNELIEEGNLIINKVGKSVLYTITDKALLNEVDELQKIQFELCDTEARQVKQAVILVAESKRDFDGPVCLMEIEEGVTLLDRMLMILKNNGIEKVIIVSEYRKEVFYEKGLSTNITIIENDQYKWAESMTSLAAVYEEVDDDFLLIKDNILIEDAAIQKVLNYQERDCLLVTSGSKSKDLRQLNQIDGEVIGVTKISKTVFNEMIKVEEGNQNLYMNYRNMLIELSNKIDIGYLKMTDLLWAEVDTQEHYEEVVEKIYPTLKHKEKRIKCERVKKVIQEALDVPVEKISGIRAFGGMTNLNYRALIDDAEFVVRMPGVGTDEFINRREEMVNLQLGTNLGINPEELYFNAETGLKITRMIPDAETLTPGMTKQEEIMKMVTSILRVLHYSDEKMKNDFELFKLMDRYEAIAREAKGAFFKEFEEIKKDVYKVKELYKALTIERVPTHIDALAENFIKSGDDKMYLIDWEYSGMFDPLWDVAAHSIESEFNVLEENLFLSLYFQREMTELEGERILIHKIFQDYLWTLWTIFKEAKGDDFGSYGRNRFERLKVNIKQYQKEYGEVIH